MHGRNGQRITGPMLFRLLRVAIPQTRSRSNAMRGRDEWADTWRDCPSRFDDFTVVGCHDATRLLWTSGRLLLLPELRWHHLRNVVFSLTCPQNQLSNRSQFLCLRAQIFATRRSSLTHCGIESEIGAGASTHTLGLANNAGLEDILPLASLAHQPRAYQKLKSTGRI